MTAEMAWNIGFTVLSGLAAIITITQAVRAWNGASKAKQYRDEIVGYRKSADVASIEAQLTRAINIVKKYGPAASVDTIVGLDHKKEAHEVSDFIAIQRQHALLFPGLSKEIETICSEASDQLAQFVAQAHGTPGLIDAGTTLYHTLTRFSSILKASRDGLREGVLE